MIVNPWVIGLTLCSITVVALVLRVVIPSIILLVRGEADELAFQLAQEKKEMLGSAVLWLVWVYYLFSPFLLTAAAFDLGKQIPGAMCPVGTFNANAYGFPLLLVRLWSVFFVLTWIALYSLDMKTSTTPFRAKRRLLVFFLFLWILFDTILQTLFFSSLDPMHITSCCAVVFDPTGSWVDNPVGILARMPSRAAFAIVAGMYLCLGWWAVKSSSHAIRLWYGLFAPIFFFYGLSAVISCISPYIYAMPHHHCPFCILRGKEGFIGVPLMLSLYAGGVSGWYAGVWQLASRSEKLPESIERKSSCCYVVSIAGNAVFFAGAMIFIGIYEMVGEVF